MVWKKSPVTESDGRVKVTVETNGDVVGKKYSGDTPIKTAVEEMMNSKSLKNCVVEDADGNEIDEDQGNNPLSSVGNLTITPEAVGAQDEEKPSEETTEEKPEDKPEETSEEKPEDEKPAEETEKPAEATE